MIPFLNLFALPSEADIHSWAQSKGVAMALIDTSKELRVLREIFERLDRGDQFGVVDSQFKIDLALIFEREFGWKSGILRTEREQVSERLECAERKYNKAKEELVRAKAGYDRVHDPKAYAGRDLAGAVAALQAREGA